MSKLPASLKWLSLEPEPKILVEALRHYGVLEHAGRANNPDIMKWAAELNITSVITGDDVPWCGVFIGICVKRAGYNVVSHPYRAKSWVFFGVAVSKAMLGDILVFSRTGGNHVGIYVGEDASAYCVYGGNQSNMVNCTWISKDRLIAIRRTPWREKQPENIRSIHLTRSGELSQNEQ
jgi:uncharacterized protein (TIGR02594 family)